MSDWDREVLAREDLTPLEKLVYHLPWYDGTVAELGKLIGKKRDYAAKIVGGLVKKGLLVQVKYGAYQPVTLTQKRVLCDTPVLPETRVSQDTRVSSKTRSEPESVSSSTRLEPHLKFKVNKVIKYFKLVDYRIESEGDRTRYNRCVEKLRGELTEPGTSADLIHRAALAYVHYMIDDKTLDKMLADGKRAIAAGTHGFLYAYFCGALKKHLLSQKIELGVCRTNKQITLDEQKRFDFGNRDLPGQKFFEFDEPERTPPKPHFPVKPVLSTPARKRAQARTAAEPPTPGFSFVAELKKQRQQAKEPEHETEAEGTAPSVVPYSEFAAQVAAMETLKEQRGISAKERAMRAAEEINAEDREKQMRKHVKTINAAKRKARVSRERAK